MNRARLRFLAGALSLAAGVVVFAIATVLFPYHSLNHDEAVYLQQAATLLSGQFSMYPGDIIESVRPWFFVVDGGRMYPKYVPVPAALFALGNVVWSYRISLAAIAAANVALTYSVTAEAFDRRRGLLAGLLLLSSPLFLIDSSVFLPYAPTTMLNLLFAFCYIRAARTERLEYAALAGIAIGLAFFARPYTALLFAMPFIIHALVTLATGFTAERLGRQTVIALLGLAFVGIALAYNALVTGSFLTFPYEAFAPHDGLGFGYHEILGYERVYTVPLALRANAAVVISLFTEWVAGGVLGTVLCGLGLIAWLRSIHPLPSLSDFSDDHARALLAGLFVSVIVGNVYFWGNLNILGSLSDPADGLIHFLGPYYHFDLLIPAAAFAAHGVWIVGRWSRKRANERFEPQRARRIVSAVAVCAVLVSTLAVAGTLAPPIHANGEVTDAYEQAYAPFENREFEHALVFLPTPYGPWLNHPFQALRNSPELDGPVVYAIDDPPDTFDVIDTFPNRTLYRYSYHGEWVPSLGRSVEPRLTRLRVVRGERVVSGLTLSLPDWAERVSLRLAGGDEAVYYTTNGTPDRLSLRLVLTSEGARLRGVRPVGTNASVPVEEGTLTLLAFVDSGTGSGFSYRIRLGVDDANGTVRAISPYLEVCVVADRCGGEAAYIPERDRPGRYLDVTLRVMNQSDEIDRIHRYRNRSSRPTLTMDFPIATPPESGSSFVSPTRLRYGIGRSTTR